MKKLIIVAILLTCTSCSLLEASPEEVGVPAYLFTPEAKRGDGDIALTPNSKMYIQYSGEIDLTQPMDVYNIDLFDTNPAVIAQLHERGVYVMCYFSAGTMEDWRPDANAFPENIIGNPLEDWPGEYWLDIRAIDSLKPVIESRLDLAAQKGCDGVDPDNVNGFENETGFPLNYQDQLNFNIYLAKTAHAKGLDVGLKNDLSQISDLVSYFDWALNEECFYFDECDALKPFQQAGKPVFVIEYDLQPEEFCAQAQELGFIAVQKDWELDEYYYSCG